MDREERVNQFAKDMEMFGDYVTEYGFERFDYDKVAANLDILGYHKTVWHKVAENDLPKRQGQKVWLCTISKDYFMANYWDDTEVGGKQFFEVASAGRITLSNVLAWMELPKYEEK